MKASNGSDSLMGSLWAARGKMGMWRLTCSAEGVLVTAYWGLHMCISSKRELQSAHILQQTGGKRFFLLCWRKPSLEWRVFNTSVIF